VIHITIPTSILLKLKNRICTTVYCVIVPHSLCGRWIPTIPKHIYPPFARHTFISSTLWRKKQHVSPQRWCPPARLQNIIMYVKHCSIDHVGSVTTQSLCIPIISNKNGALITPCFPLLPIFLQLNCHGHRFYMFTVCEWRHHRCSNDSNGYGFSVVTIELGFYMTSQNMFLLQRKTNESPSWHNITI
jgi:hypothetical protein